MTLCLSTNRFNQLQTNLLISKGMSEGHESFKMRSCIRISAALHPSSTGLLLRSRENPRTDYGFHFRLCFLRKYTNLSSFLGEFLALLSTFFHILSCDSFKANLVNIMISSDLNSQSSDQSLPVECSATLYFLKFINLAICLIYSMAQTSNIFLFKEVKSVKTFPPFPPS